MSRRVIKRKSTHRYKVEGMVTWRKKDETRQQKEKEADMRKNMTNVLLEQKERETEKGRERNNDLGVKE